MMVVGWVVKITRDENGRNAVYDFYLLELLGIFKSLTQSH